MSGGLTPCDELMSNYNCACTDIVLIKYCIQLRYTAMFFDIVIYPAILFDPVYFRT